MLKWAKWHTFQTINVTCLEKEYSLGKLCYYKNVVMWMFPWNKRICSAGRNKVAFTFSVNVLNNALKILDTALIFFKEPWRPHYPICCFLGVGRMIVWFKIDRDSSNISLEFAIFVHTCANQPLKRANGNWILSMEWWHNKDKEETVEKWTHMHIDDQNFWTENIKIHSNPSWSNEQDAQWRNRREKIRGPG